VMAATIADLTAISKGHIGSGAITTTTIMTAITTVTVIMTAIAIATMIMTGTNHQ
jgi:hypothetical protein